MVESINEPISVLAVFEPRRGNSLRVTPYRIKWRGQDYNLTTKGLHHPRRDGAKRVHVFQFSSGSLAFRVELDPDSLEWTLREVWYGD